MVDPAVTGAYALDPGNFSRLFMVAGSQQAAAEGAGCTQDAFEFRGGDDVFQFAVFVQGQLYRVKGFKARYQQDGARFNLDFFILHVVVDGACLAGF